LPNRSLVFQCPACDSSETELLQFHNERPFEIYRCLACGHIARVSRDRDQPHRIVIARRVRSGEVRWLLSDGSVEICDTPDKFEALQRGCALARTYRGSCFISAGENADPVDCSQYSTP
jgi:Zn ribbon nucleic-acid-binding protein